MEFLRWVEDSGFSTWVRESGSVWAYPTILFLHTVGLGLVMGISSAIDLRLLGFAPRTPIKPYERFFPYMWTGFWINAASGFVLLMADATTKLASPIFYTKMAFITLAIADIWLIRKWVFRNPVSDKMTVPMTARVLAALSLVFWVGATTAGRLMAYLGPVSGGLPGMKNHF